MPSTLACMISVLLWNGCRRTSRRLVEIPARCVHRSLSSAFTDITNHDRSPFLERAQERHPPPITTLTIIFPLLPELLYALFSRGSRSRDDAFFRSSNQEPHPLFIPLMRTVTSPLGCSSRTTCRRVSPRPQTTRSLAS